MFRFIGFKQRGRNAALPCAPLYAYFFILFFISFSLLGCSRSEEPLMVVVSGPTMGTSYNIKYLSSPKVSKTDEQITKVIADSLLLINNLMSTYSKESEISRFNQSAINTWFSISKDTYEVILQAQELSELTMGSFDITVAKLVDLWGFGPTLQADQVPLAEDIAGLLQDVGYQQIEVKDTPYALLKRKNLSIDLSAIAKGYAVDIIAGVLDNADIDNYLVEIGGEIRAKGAKQDGSAWRIAIESPVVTERAVHKVIELNDYGVATSGDYRNYFEKNGKRYSHTIDPITGYPITHKLASVTIIAQTTALADALATAFMVMGEEKSIRFAETNKVAAFLIVKTDDGFREVASASFKEFINKGVL